MGLGLQNLYNIFNRWSMYLNSRVTKEKTEKWVSLTSSLPLGNCYYWFPVQWLNSFTHTHHMTGSILKIVSYFNVYFFSLLNISWFYQIMYLEDFSISHIELNFVLNRLLIFALYICTIIYLNRSLLTFKLIYWFLIEV